jgi:hypothetical protein
MTVAMHDRSGVDINIVATEREDSVLYGPGEVVLRSAAANGLVEQSDELPRHFATNLAVK